MSTQPLSSRFLFEPIGIAGAFSITMKPVADQRGVFSRLFCTDEMSAVGWGATVAQVNHSHTVKAGTIRGMHFQQPPFSEAKLVMCLRQRVWDVILDLRADSATYLKWFALELSADNHKALLIPPGCAHGFQTLSDDVELLYFHSKPYEPDADDGINPLDPMVDIRWPLDITVISDKDSSRRSIGSDFLGLRI
jgi:dTDP-4-dehydrorhamnose 3,5-epimerase